ncbi:MAG: hypothetical protein IT336_03285 [Thermomicrobiales bacterium]|nr:hypothetical protein [Thermomicrobiales bacterium]
MPLTVVSVEYPIRMEPRPLSKPQRPTTPAPVPAPSHPPLDRGGWTPPPSMPAPSYVPPSIPVEPTYVPPAYEPTASRGAWYEPVPSGGPPPPPQGYSPGPALTPIDGSRGAKLLGPLFALVVLAAVVVAVVFVVVRVFGDDDGRDNGGNLAANGTATTQAVTAPTEAATVEATGEPTEETGAVAGADETGESETSGQPADETPEPTATTEEAEPTKGPVSARSMLPTTGDLPEGFQRVEDDKRVKEAVAASFSDSDEAMELLNEWEWRENAYRTFEMPEGTGDPARMTFINISIHRFGTEQGAKDALTYFADDVIGTQGLEEFDVDRIGEQSRALKGAPDGANLVVLYIRIDNYLIRIGGSSPQGDPTAEVITMAEQIAG